MKKYPEAREQEVVEQYFTHIRDLRSGKEEAVEKLIELWDADGTFEFAGAPPITATFQGRNAIHVLYRNRLHANQMPLRLESEKGEGSIEAALGVVDTDVHRMRVVDDKLVAGWTTSIGTADSRGFQVSGAHTFTFTNGKISGLKVVISPRPESAEGLNLAGLSVNDIGRLALAAWPVV